jgi:UDP-N-acetylmuramoyl-L-alanyl-D-glutamate--2,6-diaminopimelate ligase
VNVDDPYGEILSARIAASGLARWTFAVEYGADVCAREIERTATGMRFRLVEDREGARFDATVDLQLIGRFNVANALAAAATARAAGFTFDDVVVGLSQPVVVPGRVERIDAGQPFAVYVDYAHTPDALARVLDAAREHAQRDVIAVFGCGGDRDRAKRPLMGRMVAERADLAVLTSDNPRSEDPDAIAAEVLPGLHEGRARVLVELDRRAAIAAALHAATDGSVVVIAGKGHETGQTIGDVTIPFDDRTVAREELGALGWS